MQMLLPDQHSLEGAYSYRLNGKATQITESFVINRLGVNRYLANGARQVAGQVRLRACGELVGGALQRGSFEWTDELGSIKRSYESENGEWQVDGVNIDAPGNAPLFGLLRVFTGPLLLTILKRGGKTQIVTPSLSADPDRDHLLRPLISERVLQDLGVDDLQLGNQLISARKMTFSGGPYEQASQCWLNEHGLLLGYDWEQAKVGQWQVRMQA